IKSNENDCFIDPNLLATVVAKQLTEKETDFTSGMKQNHIIWSEIASKMIKDSNGKYNVTGQQCSVKLSGLKKAYKIMDSIFGKKAYVIPPAIASSKGPAEPTPSTSSEPITNSPSSSNPIKKRKVEIVLESFSLSPKIQMKKGRK
ncbi:hypothetical protein ALC57_00394, partial [Trachymyrmex cornetzi]